MGFKHGPCPQGAPWPRWRNIGNQVDPHMGVQAGAQAQSCWGLTQCWGETERKRDRCSVWKPMEPWSVRHTGMNALGWPRTQGCAHWGQEYNRLVWFGSSKFANFFKEVILVSPCWQGCRETVLIVRQQWVHSRVEPLQRVKPVVLDG